MKKDEIVNHLFEKKTFTLNNLTLYVVGLIGVLLFGWMIFIHARVFRYSRHIEQSKKVIIQQRAELSICANKSLQKCANQTVAAKKKVDQKQKKKLEEIEKKEKAIKKRKGLDPLDLLKAFKEEGF